ncbi:hypothetical protein TIFTF001_009534 [Ficus carica]|uniref:Uncharacterized protein n=1 Tax=Ficus carica TaxID=3494 RepID=A0AA88CZ24_FICCA|nr:hypothetical protein TIFTF001_009534 [Ficus carica]
MMYLWSIEVCKAVSVLHPKVKFEVDTIVLSMRREIEELKEMVHGLCAKKDVEPSVYQENMPTVVQHNSFKASCILHDKQPSVFDPPTMPGMDGEPSHRYSSWDTTRTDTPDAGLRERADALVAFLRNAPKGRLYLVPHYRGRHWVLGVIDPWEDLVLYILFEIRNETILLI